MGNGGNGVPERAGGGGPSRSAIVAHWGPRWFGVGRSGGQGPAGATPSDLGGSGHRRGREEVHGERQAGGPDCDSQTPDEADTGRVRDPAAVGDHMDSDRRPFRLVQQRWNGVGYVDEAVSCLSAAAMARLRVAATYLERAS